MGTFRQQKIGGKTAGNPLSLNFLSAPLKLLEEERKSAHRPHFWERAPNALPVEDIYYLVLVCSLPLTNLFSAALWIDGKLAPKSMQ